MYYRNQVHTSISSRYGIRREIVYETDSEDEALERETALILEHKTHPSLPGGWGANFIVRATRQRVLHTPEATERKREGAQRGWLKRSRVVSDEERKNKRVAHLGVTFSEERRRNISEALKRYNATATPRRASLETRAKISNALRGKPHPQSTPVSAETRAKVSAASKRMWARRRYLKASHVWFRPKLQPNSPP
jgi:hypothetical protein